MFILNIYKKYISPITHLVGRSFFGSSFSCRFSPTCSQYAKLAILKYGIIRGGVLALKRIGRCHPWSNSPYEDPVP